MEIPRMLFWLFLGLVVLLMLTACTVSHVVENRKCTVEKREYGAVVKCGDKEVEIYHGEDGLIGEPGQDAYTIVKAYVDPWTCQEVMNNVWVRNRFNGFLFDVYSNKDCQRKEFRYCRDVMPARGKRGSGTVCWAEDNIQVSGVRNADGSITVYLVDFL